LSWPIRLDLWSISVGFGYSRLGYGLFFLQVVGFFFVANGLICGLLVYDLSNSSWFVSDSWPIRFDLWCVSVVFGILGWDMVYFSTGSWIFFLVANGFQFILICVVRLAVPIGKIACSLF